MESNRFKFTNTNIKSLPNPAKRTFYYDTVEPKLSLQITPNGAKSFYVRQRVKGNDIRVKLGEPPIMTVEEARIAAVASRKMARTRLSKAANTVMKTNFRSFLMTL